MTLSLPALENPHLWVSSIPFAFFFFFVLVWYFVLMLYLFLIYCKWKLIVFVSAYCIALFCVSCLLLKLSAVRSAFLFSFRRFNSMFWLAFMSWPAITKMMSVMNIMISSHAHQSWNINYNLISTISVWRICEHWPKL